MNKLSQKCSKYYILISSLILFAVGTLFHFLFDILGENFIIGLFVPVNESVWEHCKMVVLPIILWWALYYKYIKKTNSINSDKWFTAMLISLVVAIITIPFLFYFYTGAFGVELVVVDIIILFLAILCGQSLACHYYKHTSKCLNKYVAFAIALFIVIIFIIFTVYTPKLPIFMDSLTQTYGIQK